MRNNRFAASLQRFQIKLLRCEVAALPLVVSGYTPLRAVVSRIFIKTRLVGEIAHRNNRWVQNKNYKPRVVSFITPSYVMTLI